MAPIRVGIIGLSSATTNISASPGDGWAASAHLPYLLASPHYIITALCNSSVSSAQAAVKRHNLPPSTKTYGSPKDLAADPDVDLVVINVRVAQHHALAMPSLRTGKDIFVEWPVASNLLLAEEMLQTAKQSGSKTIVGLQARNSPVILNVKRLVEEKAIGALLSSSVTYTTGMRGDAEPPPTIRYTAEKAAGGNMFTIIFGHTADPVFFALGGLASVSALLSTRWTESKILAADGSLETVVARETPDHVLLHGTLGTNGAPISIAMRSGNVFRGTSALEWRVFGMKGEIRVTANAPISMALGGEKIELFDHEKDTVETVNVEYGDKVKELLALAKNVGGLYELFVKGGGVRDGFVDLETALGFHRLLDAMERSSEGGRVEKVV